MKTWKRVCLGMIAATGAIACVAGYLGNYHSTEFCAACGERRDTVEQQIPFVSDSTLFTYSRREQATLVSEVAKSSGCLKDHAHDWKFAFASANCGPAYCGDGRVCMNSDNPRCVQFLRDVGRCCSVEETRRWIAMMLDRRSPEIDRKICEYPIAGLQDCAELREWMAGRELTLDSPR